MNARPYKLGQRQATVDETRATIVAAARRLLGAKRPTVNCSMDAVARAAGVARMTVYHQFTSKRGLLEALFDDLGERGLLPELRIAFEIDDPLSALGAMIRAFCHFWMTERLVIRRIRGLATFDPDFEAALAERDDRRRRGFLSVLTELSAKTGPLKEADLPEAVQVVLALTSFETFDSLAQVGTEPEATAALICRLVSTALGLPALPTAAAIAANAEPKRTAPRPGC